mmetsp:Transcript_9947/g.21030  ORF Transcript_9947/g.21030 Transcript_9947/m.21030 type:complete len:177 (-) Transcript_9947:71-601(-)
MSCMDGQITKRRATYPCGSTWCESSNHKSPAPPKPTKQQQKCVGFKVAEIREYFQCVGDNPSCSSGPPISLDWKYRRQSRRLSIDDYEAGRLKRRHNNFEISEQVRIDRLLQLGYPIQDLLQADIQKTKDQLLRQRTAGGVKGLHIDEIFERIRMKYIMQMRKRSPVRSQHTAATA